MCLGRYVDYRYVIIFGQFFGEVDIHATLHLIYIILAY